MFARPLPLLLLATTFVVAPQAIAGDEKLDAVARADKNWTGFGDDDEVLAAVDAASFTMVDARLAASRDALDAFEGQDVASRTAELAMAMAETVHDDRLRRDAMVASLQSQRVASIEAIGRLEKTQAATLARCLAELDAELDGYETEADALVNGLQGWHQNGVLARAIWDRFGGRDALERHVAAQFAEHVYDAQTLHQVLADGMGRCERALDDDQQAALSAMWTDVPRVDLPQGGVQLLSVDAELDVEILMGVPVAGVLAERGAAAAVSFAPVAIPSGPITWGATLVVGGLAEMIASHFIRGAMAGRIERLLDATHEDLVHGDAGLEGQLRARLAQTHTLLKQAVHSAVDEQIRQVQDGV